jgi:K+-transporting ATPase KdpF subunit
VGHRLCRRNFGFLHVGNRLRIWLRNSQWKERPRMTEAILLFTIIALLFVYLVVALLRPEKF